MSLAREAVREAVRAVRPVAGDVAERRPATDVWQQPGGVTSSCGDWGGFARVALDLQRGATTCAALVEDGLEAIARRNEALNAFAEVDAEGARAQAGALDRELVAGRPRGPLHGIPMSVKDVIHVSGMTTRAGSRAFSVRAPRDADSVRRLRQAGAIVLGKTTTHEFALGVTTPQARNPHDEGRIPGGSSGGSAIAVATGMGMASLGTDTRASVRVPASLCGVVGFRPTYGLLSTDGIVPLSWTMDTPGIIAGSVGEAAEVLAALSGGHARNGTPPAPDDHPLRVGVPAAAVAGADRGVAAAFSSALEELEAGGVDLLELERPTLADLDLANSAGMLASRCEAATYHRARHTDLTLCSAEIREQLDAAAEVTAADYIDAQRVRADLRRAMSEAFAHSDAMAMPATPSVAPRVDEADAYLMALSRNAIMWSLVGFPAISVPIGPADHEMPVGLQLVGPPGSEGVLIRVGALLEARIASAAGSAAPG